ncbi:hypothetical protein O9993_17520 [Vibrio lentus]|nr:hypothetical protein [Vibrio lentus]
MKQTDGDGDFIAIFDLRSSGPKTNSRIATTRFGIQATASFLSLDYRFD